MRQAAHRVPVHRVVGGVRGARGARVDRVAAREERPHDVLEQRQLQRALGRAQLLDGRCVRQRWSAHQHEVVLNERHGK